MRWAVHLVIMAALPVLVGLLGAARSGDRPALPPTVKGVLIVCGLELAVFAVIYLLAWLASRATKDDLLLRWRPGFWVLPLGAAYSVAIRIATGVVMAFIGAVIIMTGMTSEAKLQQFTETHRPKVEVLIDLDAMAHNPVYFWLNVTLVSMVVAGLREELWRSAFLAGLRSMWPKAFGGTGGGLLAAAIASLFFGVAHFPQGVLAVGLTAILGFGLGAIMVLHRSIWPAVLAHGFFDATSFALIPVALQFIQKLQHAAPQ